MSRWSELFGQEISEKAAKAAADSLWAQKDGAGAYSQAGKIFAGCGAGWFLLSLIPLACKTPVSECLWMWILAAVQIILGFTLITLSKKSPKFRKWAEQDFIKDLKKKEHLEDKVTVKSRTLPITHADVLAFKILGVLILIFIIIMGIGTLQGWVVW